MDTYKEMKAVVTWMQYETGANPDRPGRLRLCRPSVHYPGHSVREDLPGP